jgi:cytochrome c oxidase subunit 2
MSNETLFYIVGGALVVLALVTAFAGLRWEKFPPSKGVLAGVVTLYVMLIGATATFGWMNGEDEQEHRNHEIAEGHIPSPQESVLEGTQAPEEEAGGEETETTTTAEETASVDGAAVFADTGCGSCHTLNAAGTTGATGPNLDESLSDKDVAYIEQSIVDPNQDIAEGFGPDIMPQTYGESLSPEELDALVAYLSESTSG